MRHPPHTNLLSVTLAICLVFISAPSVYAKCGKTEKAQLELMKEKLPTLQAWLVQTELSEKFEIMRLRCTPHPLLETFPYAYRLEMRWRNPISIEVDPLTEFGQFSSDFQSFNKQHFETKLFFKAINNIGLPAETTIVHVHVANTDVATYLSDSGYTVTTNTIHRNSVTHAPVPSSDIAQLPSLNLTERASVVEFNEKVVDIMEGLVTDHYDTRGSLERLHKNSNLRLISFGITGLKNEVVKGGNHWEELEGTLVLSFRHQEFDLLLHLDGRFAAGGLSANPPKSDAYSDMEPRYNKQLNNYAMTKVSHWAHALSPQLK